MRPCAHKRPLGPRPIVQIGSEAKLLIASQAPGRKVHQTGAPFDDPSGDTLRAWLGVDRTTFYDPSQIAILPMAFCYPGYSRHGDLPPSPECAPLWRARLLALIPKVELTLVVGQVCPAASFGRRRQSDTYRDGTCLPRVFATDLSIAPSVATQRTLAQTPSMVRSRGHPGPAQDRRPGARQAPITCKLVGRGR